MTDLLRLCRPYYALPMSLIFALTVWYILGERIGEAAATTALACLAIALVIAGGYVLNDVCDRRVDRVNAPLRPIPAGRITARSAARLAALLFLLGLLLAAICRWRFFLALAVVAGAVILYDFHSKRLGLGKQLLVAALMTSYYPLAFALAGAPTTGRGATLFAFPVWIFLTSFGYETLKDLRDVQGDRLAAERPSWVQRRPRRARRIARIALAAGACALVGPALLGCGWVYAAIAPVAMVFGFVAATLPERPARQLIYAQFVVVGIAATADIMVLGP